MKFCCRENADGQMEGRCLLQQRKAISTRKVSRISFVSLTRCIEKEGYMLKSDQEWSHH